MRWRNDSFSGFKAAVLRKNFEEKLLDTVFLKNVPIVEGIWPLKTNFPSDIEAKPSNEFQIPKREKLSKFNLQLNSGCRK